MILKIEAHGNESDVKVDGGIEVKWLDAMFFLCDYADLSSP